MAESSDDDRLVTVCTSCLTASCVRNECICEEYLSAGTQEMAVRALRALHREHPDAWRRCHCGATLMHYRGPGIDAALCPACDEDRVGSMSLETGEGS